MFDCTRCGKPVEEDGTLCEDCVVEQQNVIVPPPPPPTSSGPAEKPQPIPRMPPRETVRDRIPRVSGMAKVTVYAYSVGLRGYRYTLSVPPVASVAWKKEMSGTQATQFLRGIKRGNRHNRLESKVLRDV